MQWLDETLRQHAKGKPAPPPPPAAPCQFRTPDEVTYFVTICCAFTGTIVALAIGSLVRWVLRRFLLAFLIWR